MIVPSGGAGTGGASCFAGGAALCAMADGASRTTSPIAASMCFIGEVSIARAAQLTLQQAAQLGELFRRHALYRAVDGAA